MGLELPGGIKVLNPSPVDDRMKVNNLFNPTGADVDLSTDPTLYVGFFPIYDAETKSQYMVTGGNSDVGWTFTLFSGTRIDQTLPEASLSLSEGPTVESGTTINPIITPSFTRNDGGVLKEVRIYKDGVLIQTQANLSSFQEVSGYKTVPGDYVYSIEVDYGTSEYIPAGSTNASSIIFVWYANYAGTTDGSADAGTIKSLEKSYSYTVELETGTENTTFICAVPKDYYVASRVVDGEAGGFDILNEYTESVISLTDAGGDIIDYIVYRLDTMIPYSRSRDHIFTLKDS